MFRYILVFKKQGLLRFTSHLDMLRLFKRAFKKAQVPLAYSQGFNPHPKMGFAHPLSLGYYSNQEILEFETTASIDCNSLKESLSEGMALGMIIDKIESFDEPVKSLASRVISGDFTIEFPIEIESERWLKDFLNQEKIICLKKGKKDKKLKEVDIKSMILNIQSQGTRNLLCKLSQGSNSNLSPELLINAILEFSGLKIDRYEIEVTRENLNFDFDFAI